MDLPPWSSASSAGPSAPSRATSHSISRPLEPEFATALMTPMHSQWPVGQPATRSPLRSSAAQDARGSGLRPRVAPTALSICGTPATATARGGLSSGSTAHRGTSWSQGGTGEAADMHREAGCIHDVKGSGCVAAVHMRMACRAATSLCVIASVPPFHTPACLAYHTPRQPCSRLVESGHLVGTWERSTRTL